MFPRIYASCTTKQTIRSIAHKNISRMLASGKVLTLNDIKHDASNGVFYIPIETHKAELFYRKEKSIIHLDHTEVPSELNGRGVGKVLAEVRFSCIYFLFKFHNM